MKKDSVRHTSQDYDRNHAQDHISNNPRAAKDIPTLEDSGTTDTNKEIAELISKGHTLTDKPSLKAKFAED